MKIQYKADGLCYGSYWGSGEGAYQAKKYHADTIEKLEKDIQQGINNGSIDGGMGYEKVIGAYMAIETIKIKNIKGVEFKNSTINYELYGDLTEDQQEFLLNCN